MQKVLILSVITFLIVLFSSCSGEDEIYGVYSLVSVSSISCDDPIENLFIDFSNNGGCSTISGIEFCGEGTISINENQTFSIMITLRSGTDTISETITGDFTENGDSITLCDGPDCGTGDISGKEIQLIFENDRGCGETYIGRK